MSEYQKISIKNLVLDTNNPRLPKSMANKSEKEIINFFLSETSLVELMLAIGKNNFFEGEQLLVIPESEKFIVIEGNRRLSAVKLLKEPQLADIYKSKVEQVIDEADYFPTEIPCLVFKEKEEILKYLGFRHITGIKQWKLLEKARYITKLKDDMYSAEPLQLASREIAKMIGSRRDYVLRILVGYKLYDIIEKNGFYKIKNLNDTTFHFNYIADSLIRSNIAEFLGVKLNDDIPTDTLNLEHLKEWTNWLFNKGLPNKIIGDSEHLNTLNKVVASPDALNVFRNGEKLFKAFEYTDGIDEQFRNAINEAVKQLEKADSLTHKVNNFYSALIDDLQNINKIIRKIKTVKDELETDDFEDEL
ncbi:MAG: hypothetical protein L3J41_00015 [Melioribacteraceae bacterium]|nr:hypothetical protein [Melioribacteraceae bacterium]